MYSKTTWQSGDTVTAVRMNNIENGITNLPPVTLNDVGKYLKVYVDYNNLVETDVISSQVVSTTALAPEAKIDQSSFNPFLYFTAEGATMYVNNASYEVTNQNDSFTATDSSTGVTYAFRYISPKASSEGVYFSAYNGSSPVGGRYTIRLTTLAPRVYYGVSEEEYVPPAM